MANSCEMKENVTLQAWRGIIAAALERQLAISQWYSFLWCTYKLYKLSSNFISIPSNRQGRHRSSITKPQQTEEKQSSFFNEPINLLIFKRNFQFSWSWSYFPFHEFISICEREYIMNCKSWKSIKRPSHTWNNLEHEKKKEKHFFWHWWV